MTIPDNYSQWEAHEQEQQKQLERLPVCDICGDPIQDTHMYKINGECICPDCLENCFREEICDSYE